MNISANYLINSFILFPVIQACQDRNIDCIVAPYEADAQLAHLNLCGIADFVISEDSDLTLFGCQKILFKLDSNGNGVLYDKERLPLCLGIYHQIRAR